MQMDYNTCIKHKRKDCEGENKLGAVQRIGAMVRAGGMELLFRPGVFCEEQERTAPLSLLRGRIFSAIKVVPRSTSSFFKGVFYFLRRNEYAGY